MNKYRQMFKYIIIIIIINSAPLRLFMLHQSTSVNQSFYDTDQEEKIFISVLK